MARRIEIKHVEDLSSGGLFALIGGAALVIAQAYPMGTATRMGPGYLPSVLSFMLLVLGLAIVVTSLRLATAADGGDGGASRRAFAALGHSFASAVRPTLFVAGALIAFAFLLPSFGLVVAVMAVVLISSFADHEGFRPVLAVTLAVTLATVTVLIFVRGLGLPLQVWP